MAADSCRAEQTSLMAYNLNGMTKVQSIYRVQLTSPWNGQAWECHFYGYVVRFRGLLLISTETFDQMTFACQE